jgi:sugar-specific transcriptional regulator TrmB
MTIVSLSENLLKELTDFGLSGNQAKVYLALLQLKKASAREVARLANIPRQEIYRVLPELEKLGMVEVVIDKPTAFLAVNPGKVLSNLIENKKEKVSKQLEELGEKKRALEDELSKVEGKSAGFARPEPVRFSLISGQRMINEKIEEMLRNAKSEVLWIAPKLEINRAIIYDRDEALRTCARRNVKVRIITEVDEKNVKEITQLSKFCDIRHSQGVTSLATIVDGKELVIGSAVYSSENLTNGGLMHELWTNDSGHVTVMKDFFEKVWEISMPAELEISSIRSGKVVQSIAVVQGTEKVKKQLLDSIADVQSKLFILSKVDGASVSLVAAQLESLQRRNVSVRWVTVVDSENSDMVEKLAAKIKLRSVRERPISFVVTDSHCLFSSSPVLQIPHEVVWSIDHNTVNMFWALAEEIWTGLSEDIAKRQ